MLGYICRTVHAVHCEIIASCQHRLQPAHLICINVQLSGCCTFWQHWCKLPEDGDCAETCSS